MIEYLITGKANVQKAIPLYSDYCSICVERKELRMFEVVNRHGLWLVPFCKLCAYRCGKEWNKPDMFGNPLP